MGRTQVVKGAGRVQVSIPEYDGIITVDELTAAIVNSVSRKGMEAEAAREMSIHVLNFFGYGDRIVDNVLEPEDRDVFYMLEDTGILTTEREETTLYDGREWRIHYWLFNRDRIKELLHGLRKVDRGITPGVGEVYTEIPEDIWRTRAEITPLAEGIESAQK